jgi:hypothetical protein
MKSAHATAFQVVKDICLCILELQLREMKLRKLILPIHFGDSKTCSKAFSYLLGSFAMNVRESKYPQAAMLHNLNGIPLASPTLPWYASEVDFSGDLSARLKRTHRVELVSKYVSLDDLDLFAHLFIKPELATLLPSTLHIQIYRNFHQSRLMQYLQHMCTESFCKGAQAKLNVYVRHSTFMNLYALLECVKEHSYALHAVCAWALHDIEFSMALL